MRLDEALSDISKIRSQIDRAQNVRGFRSLTTAFSGVLAVLAVVVQAQFIAVPTENLDGYLNLWGAVALVSILIAAIEIVWRNRRSTSDTSRRVSLSVIKKFSPCLLVGAVLTFAFDGGVETAVYLPGLWAILFGMGLFSSSDLLPKASVYVAGYYLLSGSLLLLFVGIIEPLSPLQMLATFGVGQMALSAVLRFGYERSKQGVARS